MSNAISSAAEPAALARPAADLDRRLEDLEQELKFTLPVMRVPVVLGWLEAFCQPDQMYEPAFVWSIYYDTRFWRALFEKINSDYLKTKVRLRWYSPLEGPVAAGPSFAEAKYRIGGRREKIRTRTSWTADWLARAPLDSPELWRLEEWLRPAGVVLSEIHYPMLTVRYRRHRFVEPVSGTRVSLDTDIRVPAVNRRFLPAIDPTPLQIAVVEVKGAVDELPRVLRGLTHLGCRRSSFSKYSAAYFHVTRSLV